MPVKEFELFHGTVLAKILRNDKPVTLRLLERSKEDPWAAYKVNDVCYIYIKYRTKFRTENYNGTIAIFDFVFPKSELDRIKIISKKFPIYFALVCGEKKAMQIAFLQPEDITKLSSKWSVGTLSLSIWTDKGKELRVISKALTKPLLIPRNRLDRWEAPAT